MTGDHDNHLLVAKLDDVRVITTMLKTISFKETAMVGKYISTINKLMLAIHSQVIGATGFVGSGLTGVGFWVDCSSTPLGTLHS